MKKLYVFLFACFAVFSAFCTGNGLKRNLQHKNKTTVLQDSSSTVVLIDSCKDEHHRKLIRCFRKDEGFTVGDWTCPDCDLTFNVKNGKTNKMSRYLFSMIYGAIFVVCSGAIYCFCEYTGCLEKPVI